MLCARWSRGAVCFLLLLRVIKSMEAFRGQGIEAIELKFEVRSQLKFEVRSELKFEVRGDLKVIWRPPWPQRLPK